MIRKSIQTQSDQTILPHTEGLIFLRMKMSLPGSNREVVVRCSDVSVAPWSPMKPLTSESDASQGVWVSQVVGSLQKTTQHGWKHDKCWPMLKNLFHRPVPQVWCSISYGATEPSQTNGHLSFSLKISANVLIVGGPHIPKPSWKAIIQRIIPILSTIPDVPA